MSNNITAFVLGVKCAYEGEHVILLIWVFSSPHFSQVCQGSVNLVYFLKEQAFCFLDSLYGFFGLYSINFSSYFYYFSPSACFGLC
jgi:hypothetical protein